MISNSKAYAELKRNHQNDAEFILLVCHAVPALNGYIKAVEGKSVPKLPDPDHFQEPQPTERLKALMPRYRKVAGRVMFLASFSYFEAYFMDLVDELVAFHGGMDEWTKTAAEKTRSRTSQKVPAARVLREPVKRSHLDKYQKAIKELSGNPGFRFPSELLATFGVFRLCRDSGEMRAKDIEEIATYALGIQIASERWTEFHKLRDQRNEIAHGRLKEMDLKNAINATKFLFALAKDIDRQTVDNFMLIEQAKAGKAGIEPAP